uniref:Sugar phosphate transporter domain-containing protein n=1 Tax=Mucochytrium quahogii TaxID=96639 RepID=A0A7S2RWG0_9STRA|mmetsp:Transcript_11049/g.18093  ORF Transcript_11049/g.18093 Transcript_11049/m.18093 type:complete len:321 (+) Transcript_11049:78-1040(+)
MSVVHVAFVAIGYAVSSSSLVIINKWALLSWPYSSTLTFIQLTVSWLVAMLVGKLGIVEVDPLNLKKIKAFSPACLIFFVCIACNMKLLEHANVDTFIVLRSTIPLFTTFAEAVAFRTALPPKRVFFTLVLIVIGAIGYVMTDKEVSLKAYFWGAAYVIAMVVDTILVKKVVTDVELTPWGLVLYNNLIASALYPFFCIMTGESTEVLGAVNLLKDPNGMAIRAVAVSCIFGVSISYFGLNARKMLQATAFSVLGVVCKFATVLINTLLWEHHAGPMGLFWLCVCIASGILYQQMMKSASFTKPNKEYSPVEHTEPAESA